MSVVIARKLVAQARLESLPEKQREAAKELYNLFFDLEIPVMTPYYLGIYIGAAVLAPLTGVPLLWRYGLDHFYLIWLWQALWTLGVARFFKKLKYDRRRDEAVNELKKRLQESNADELVRIVRWVEPEVVNCASRHLPELKRLGQKNPIRRIWNV